MHLKSIVVLSFSCMLPYVAWSQPTACMVIGSRDAVVATPQGNKSPVFLAQNCSSLKIVSGQAQASWVARDGRPRVIPITEEGVSSTPAAGSEERSVNVVWTELTSQRERQQPAYMRSIGAVRPSKVYIPKTGLLIDESDGDSKLQVFSVLEDGKELIDERIIESGGVIFIPREILKPGHIYSIELLRRDSDPKVWLWSLIPQQQIDEIDAGIYNIEKSVNNSEHQSMVKAMLYEQLKLHVNMDFELQLLRKQATFSQ